ncbi:ribose-phosphate pyrophosphokinase, partial [Francisella tularensis subsp. holarctica]|nr:ribose-phosphate pyrophosphokinase [Francisella tularensis subsp. holarctica]
ANVSAFCVHHLLSGDAINNIEESAIDEIIFTASIPLKPHAEACSKIKVKTLAPILAQSVEKTNREE